MQENNHENKVGTKSAQISLQDFANVLDALRATTDQTAATGSTVSSPSELSDVVAAAETFNELLRLLDKTGFSKLIDFDQDSKVVPDKPTKFNHLGFRVAYTVIAWIVLGKGVNQGQGFFVSLFLFMIPLLMDYMKFDFLNRKWLRSIGIALSALWTLFSLVGLFGVLSVVATKHGLVVMLSKNYVVYPGLAMSLAAIWLLLLLSVFLTVFDWWFSQGNEKLFLTTGGNVSD